MPQKIVTLENIGEVTLRRRKGSKHLRISVAAHSGVTVSMPSWSPYAAGIAFARSKTDWIVAQQNRTTPLQPITHGSQIGKAHRVALSSAVGTSVRVKQSEISGPLDASQKQLVSAAERALRKQASVLLPKRLAQLAQNTDFTYAEVTIKKMHSRWGSCSNNGVICLNIYLVQLPWELIDYVLLHELTHTKHMNHSTSFWDTLTTHYPNTKQAKKILKTYPTQVVPLNL